MKPFNELIKNFDKIREYLRAFAVYGYKQREDFAHKSPRTYDNEKRRIQSYLNPYIHEQTFQKGKCISINFDYLSISFNPLFDAFKTKSFTKNDIMLHFIILDLLTTFDVLTFSELYNKFITDYMEAFTHDKLVDERTMRLKLQEYIRYGLIIEIREGKSIHYRLAPNPLTTLSTETKDHLYRALSFYQNIAPLGLLGHFLLDKEDITHSYFAFSNLHFSNTVDDLWIAKLLTAISKHQQVRLAHRKDKNSIVLPLKIIDNVEQGRRYITAYHYKDQKYKFYRLDRLNDVEILDQTDAYFPQKLQIMNTLLDTTWGIALSGMDHPNKLETWQLLLQIDEEKEKHLLEQFTTSHQEAILQRVGMNTFHYTLSILDANESVPWLRQFIGRIISVECTNRFALQRFVNDIQVMQSYYQEDENATI